ncbi:MAG: DNA polymerase III subunit alpha [Actinobacteria bacterium]|nr:DNA polymerase III subunit alpha [Actinomycetota bacterium]
MAEPQFVHLHTHTSYSLLDGATRIDELLELCKQLGMDSLAITDHGNLFGAVEFYTKSLKLGVKPIIGCECYVAPGSRLDKEARGISDASYHLVLLARNNQGYQNLLKLASRAYTEGFYYRPRIDKEILAEFSEGLIGISGHLGTELAIQAGAGNIDRAVEAAKWYARTLGEEHFYIELQNHGQPEQLTLLPRLLEVSQRSGVPTVATNDVHYLGPKDARTQEVLMCINTGKTLDDENRMRQETDQMYLKSPAEMAKLFADYPEALANTVRIGQMCQVELDFSTRHAPRYKTPDGQPASEYLQKLAYEGLEKRYEQITDAHRERLDYELKVIKDKDFSSYFLVAWDFAYYARTHEIPCSARGSGCASLVAYCVGLSDIDPLAYGLVFERYMDPERNEAPDIDMDICQARRGKIIDYVRNKYGHVAQIITFGTLKARQAIRDVCRAMAVPLATADRISKMVPNVLNIRLAEALKAEPELKRCYEQDRTIHDVIDIALQLEGMPRHASVHAAGVVVADEPLDNFLPLYKQASSTDLITQFDGPTVDKIGLLKIDFLGLRTLTTLERSRQLVRKNHGVDIDPEKLTPDDKEVFELFAKGQTKGVFQFESPGMRDLLMKLGPNRIQDLIAANALYRPGPMVMIDDFIERKHNGQWAKVHPIVDEILTETYGIMAYQEQVMQIVHRLGGISLGRALTLIKAISKKKNSVINKERQPFMKGALANGLAKAEAEQIFDLILRFGGYGFNKAHSSRYALVAYQTAYFKRYYPLEFMAALLTFEMSNTEKVVEYIEECRRMGIEVLPPDINESDVDFTTTQGTIRFGLAAVKGVGEKAVEEIIAARNRNGAFRSLFHFCESVDLRVVNRAVVEALIKCGAFDSTGALRAPLMAVVNQAIERGSSTAEDRRRGQGNLFGSMAGQDEPEDDYANLPDVSWSESEMLAHEKATLGFYVTSHPLAAYAEWLQGLTTAGSQTLGEFADGAEVIVGGMLSRVHYRVAQNGRRAGGKMALLTVEDLEGSMDAVIFSEELAKHAEHIHAERMVFLRGQVSLRRETPSVRVMDVYPIERGMESLACSVVVHLNGDHTEKLLSAVHKIVEEYPGQCPLYFQVDTGQGYTVAIQAGEQMRVQPSAAFCGQMNALLGSGRVEIIGPNGPVGRTTSQSSSETADEQIEEVVAQENNP